MKLKKLTGITLTLTMIVSMLPIFNVGAAETTTYSCDFTQLAKNSQDTTYGSADDIIPLDEYTTAYLTYEGTYVKADGSVYLYGSNGGKGSYKNGSYIEFTAPYAGTVSFTVDYANYFVDEEYKGYASATVDLIEGQKLRIGERANDRSVVKGLTFTKKVEPEVIETDIPEYSAPSTTWDFDTYSPASQGNNLPVMSGNAQWDKTNGEVQFPADNTNSGLLTVNFENPVKDCVNIGLDVIGHTKALGQQYFNIVVSNSEEEIVNLQYHAYDNNYGNGVYVCGTRIAQNSDIFGAISSAGKTSIQISIDYTAMKATITLGTKVISGNIPEGTVADIDKVEISSTRSKTAGDRYISIDNLKIEEFTSTQTPAAVTVTNGYTEETITDYPCRVKAQNGKNAVIYLASKLRSGTNNISQLYDAQYIFNKLGDNATLIAPQAADKFTDVAALVSAVKAQYNAPAVTVIGQADSVDAAIKSGADKIITIAGASNASTDAKVWVFAGYEDETTPIADVKTMVNRLQKSGTITRYTEYPFDGHKINNIAAEENGLVYWILNNVNDTKTVDLAIFMGQSNMAGRGEYDEATKAGAGHGFELHTVTEPAVLSTLSEPFGKYENNTVVNDAGSNGIDRRSGDLVSAFMESYYNVSDVPLVGVQCSRGGTESKWWNDGGNVKNETIKRFDDAEKYLTDCGYTVGKKFMVWCQGEADADNNRDIEVYKANTIAVYEYMKTAGVTDMFVVKTGHYNGGEAGLTTDARYQKINAAQKELADANEGITEVASFFTDEALADMRDQYHYHQPTYNSVGTMAGNNTAVKLYGKGTAQPVPDSEEIKIKVDGKFEITSSDASIDISELTSYGAVSYRMYKNDGSYESVTATDNKIANNTGNEVTIVPEYSLNFATDGNGTAEFTSELGYGLSAGADYKINADGCFPQDNPINMLLPSGHYDISVERRGGARADVYSGGNLIINNTTSSGSQNRLSNTAVMDAPRIYMEEGNLALTIGNLSGSNERIYSLSVVKVPENYLKPTIWVAGDSESANYYPIDENGLDLESDKLMMTGFGMQLKYFMSDKYNIANFGQPSATVNTWASECMDSVEYQLRNGDVVLIDFGINDAASSSNKITLDEMKSRINDIVTTVKSKGAVPVLVTPVYCGKYQNKSYFTYNKETDKNDAEDFAKELGIGFIDLNKYLTLYIDKATEETGDTNWIANNYQVMKDNLHMTQYGALLSASFIAGGLDAIGYKTTDYAFTHKDASSYNEETYTVTALSGVERVYSVAKAQEFMGIEGEGKPTYPVTLSYDENTKTMTAVSTDSSIKKATLIKAVYENGTMKSVNKYDMTFETEKATMELTIEKGAVLYLWNDLDEMKPLSEKYEYMGEGELPSPFPTLTPTSEPRTVLYSQNFESETAGSTGGWTSPAGTIEIKEDSTEGIGKYQTVVSGKSGTCRSGYFELPTAVIENFVFECDYKSSGNVNVSDLALVENKSSIYANHGVYSNQNFVFTMARPLGADLYVINNKSDDSGFRVTNYDDPVFKTAEITENPWLHVTVIGNFDTQTVNVKITSLDGKTEYYHGVHNMNVGRDTKITSWKCIHLLSPSTNTDTCIDNIVVSKANSYDLAEKYHKATISCKSYSFEQYVIDGNSVQNIPDVTLYGDSFEGWTVGNDTRLYTSEELASVKITEDCEIVGQISDDYIEALANVEFNSFPAGNELQPGVDENTYGNNEISITITGEQGTSLVTNPDKRVTDYKIDWKFDGFRILDGTPTGETGDIYCDSYGLVEISETAQSKVNFKLKKTSANYYGMVTAKVTYNGKIIEKKMPLVLLGDKTQSSIFPTAGYTSNYSKYDKTLNGYEFTKSNSLFGGMWDIQGSDVSRMTFMSDNGDNFIRYSRDASGNSAYGNLNIGAIEGQTIFEQDLRFNGNGSVSYSGGGNTTPSSTAFTLNFDGSTLKFNGNKICSAVKGTWYHVIICADPTSKLSFVKVYNMNSELLAESEIVDFVDASYSGGMYYRLLPDKASNNSIDFNNIQIYAAEIDEITVTAPQTVNIPESGNTVVNISALAETSQKLAAIGYAAWSIDDEFATGVSIVSNGNQSAALTIDSTAGSGELPIRCTIGGRSKVVTIKLLGTKNSVAFTSAPLGIQLTGETADYTFTAELRNGSAEKIDDTIIYELYDQTNTNAVSLNGITMNESNGVLTVDTNAKPQTIGIRATSGDVSKFIKITLYDLKFTFGNNSLSEYTNVSQTLYYNDSRGYGFEGDTFKVKLQKGKVYNITADYDGTIICEKIDSELTGFETALKSYDIAIFGDGIMDITPKSGTTLKSISIKEVEKTSDSKPQWWTIGDSTVQQNGSWGYTIAANSTTDLSKYPNLAGVCTAFYNSGKAGEQHKNYYSNGRLNSILTQMNPGDVVSISGMGTNDSSSTLSQFKAYDKAYVDAIIDMGGYVILGSYTPTGNYGATKGKVYDADTMKFKGMRTNAYDLAIRELYENYKNNDHVLGFVDIGQMADDMMTADVQEVYSTAIESGKTDAEARIEANTKAAEMMAWWKDYNHYYTTFSDYLLPALTDKVAELITKAK